MDLQGCGYRRCLIEPASSEPDLPRPPHGLGPTGSDLWRRILREYEIHDSGSLEILHQVCQASDLAATLRGEIDRDGVILRTSRGAIKSHPGVRDELACRGFVVRGLQKLGVSLESLAPSSGFRPVGRSSGIMSPPPHDDEE
jgi:hypothetical protein